MRVSTSPITALSGKNTTLFNKDIDNDEQRQTEVMAIRSATRDQVLVELVYAADDKFSMHRVLTWLEID